MTPDEAEERQGMSACPHPDALRRAAIDLRCPLCMEAEIGRLREALRGALDMTEAFATRSGFSASGRAEFESYRRALEGKQ
jgi:hypothetical protein